MNLMSVAILVLMVVIIILLVVGYNKLVRQKVLAEEAFATMDVYLKKRFDLIPNLVETVKGYASHEQGTLENVVSLRNASYGSMSVEEKMANAAEISRAIPKVMALAEAYPDLKANQNFMELSSQLQQVEEDIANSRKYYNGAVRNYNTTVQSFPTNIIAGMFQFSQKDMYELGDAQERQNVKVKF